MTTKITNHENAKSGPTVGKPKVYRVRPRNSSDVQSQTADTDFAYSSNTGLAHAAVVVPIETEPDDQFNRMIRAEKTFADWGKAIKQLEVAADRGERLWTKRRPAPFRDDWQTKLYLLIHRDNGGTR